MLQAFIGCYNSRYHPRLRKLTGLPSLREAQVALTAAAKQARARSSTQPLESWMKRVVVHVEVVRKSLCMAKDRTMHTVRKRWKQEEKRFHRKIPVNLAGTLMNLLRARDPRATRAGIYWYVGAFPPTKNQTGPEPYKKTNGRNSTKSELDGPKKMSFTRSSKQLLQTGRY